MGHLRPLFHFFCLSKKTIQNLQQINVKNVHPGLKLMSFWLWVSFFNQKCFGLNNYQFKTKKNCIRKNVHNMHKRKWSFSVGFTRSHGHPFGGGQLDVGRLQLDVAVAVDDVSARVVRRRFLGREKCYGKITHFCQLGAAIAQWICLRLPSCNPGSSPKHTIYTFIIFSRICAKFVMWKERK